MIQAMENSEAGKLIHVSFIGTHTGAGKLGFLYKYVIPIHDQAASRSSGQRQSRHETCWNSASTTRINWYVSPVPCRPVVDAQIIWLREGYLEYLLPMDIPPGATIESLELSMEICSEVSTYNNDWPSDISVWVNGIKIGTWTSPGDLGDRHGKLNPDWCYDSSTQYGILKTWLVDQARTTLDMEKISDISLDDLNLGDKPKLRLRIGIEPDAEHQGGMNLFGNQFGDYEQHIMMRVKYSLNPDDCDGPY